MKKQYFWALSKYFLKTLKLNSSLRSEKINMVQKTKVARNSILHLLGSSKIFFRGQIFFLLKCLIFKLQFLKKGPGKNFNFFSKLKLHNFTTKNCWPNVCEIFMSLGHGCSMVCASKSVKMCQIQVFSIFTIRIYATKQ